MVPVVPLVSVVSNYSVVMVKLFHVVYCTHMYVLEACSRGVYGAC